MIFRRRPKVRVRWDSERAPRPPLFQRMLRAKARAEWAEAAAKMDLTKRRRRLVLS